MAANGAGCGTTSATCRPEESSSSKDYCKYSVPSMFWGLERATALAAEIAVATALAAEIVATTLAAEITAAS